MSDIRFLEDNNCIPDLYEKFKKGVRAIIEQHEFSVVSSDNFTFQFSFSMKHGPFVLCVSYDKYTVNHNSVEIELSRLLEEIKTGISFPYVSFEVVNGVLVYSFNLPS